ncbi:hypothetical protein C1646_674899 [Rhizophagus diaphanus]|nr:hypothetical protein C1646_674899 [Rhizophagus diaphanus] [Rhizophagus sp. MUCL 43196]
MFVSHDGPPYTNGNLYIENEYEVKQLQVLYSMTLRNTSLAEAELEYRDDYQSKYVYAKFPVIDSIPYLVGIRKMIVYSSQGDEKWNNQSLQQEWNTLKHLRNEVNQLLVTARKTSVGIIMHEQKVNYAKVAKIGVLEICIIC